MIDESALYRAAYAYAQSRKIEFQKEWRLGYGSDGSVWATSRQSAIKAFDRLQNYENERDCYRRLGEKGISELGGLAIPTLIGFDDALRVIEIDIVNPPYLIDFGKASVDIPPPYWADKQLRANTYAEWRELFDDRWQEVAGVLGMLESLGIYYFDARPSNINFGDD